MPGQSPSRWEMPGARFVNNYITRGSYFSEKSTLRGVFPVRAASLVHLMTSLIICRQLVQMSSGWPSLDLNRFQTQLRDEKKDGIYHRRKTRTGLIIHLVLTNLSFSFSLAYEYFVVMCIFHTKLAGFWPAWEEVSGTGFCPGWRTDLSGSFKFCVPAKRMWNLG